MFRKLVLRTSSGEKKVAVLSIWGSPSDESTGLSFVRVSP
jgi:hypothetical protein